MKTKKYYIIIVSVIFLIAFSNVAFAQTKIVKHKVKKIVAKKELVEKVKGDLFTLEVLGNKYTGMVKSGGTVYDAMVSLQSTKTNNFSFHSKNYSSLGNFIDEINGIKGTPGNYWIYYINNKKASLGVSKNVVKAGVIISWKQEGF